MEVSEWENIQSRFQGECDKEIEIILWANKEYENKYRNSNTLA